MMQDETCVVGADIAKDEIVASTIYQGQCEIVTLTNTKRAIRAWLARLPRPCELGVEATGGYQHLLANLAYEAGITVYELNPRRLYHYARAHGRGAKTDRLDAQVIADYVRYKPQPLRCYEPEPAQITTQRQLQGLRHVTKHVVVTLRQSLGRRLPARNARLQQAAARALDSLDELADELEAELVRQVQAHQPTRQVYELVTSVTGIGRLSGAALAALFVRREFESSDAVVAMVGLDPVPRESGRKKGLRKLSKQGERGVRALLYLAASSVCRTKLFKPYYEALRQRGLATTQALIILARKLLRIAYGVWRSGRPFEPARLQFKPI